MDSHHSKKYKIAILAPVPFYYHIPLFQEIAKHEDVDFEVIYCSDEIFREVVVKKMYGVDGKFVDKETLLYGYRHKLLRNYSPTPSFMKWPFGLVNFGIWNEIRKNHYDAIILQSWTNFTYWLAIAACVFYKTPILFMTDSNILTENAKTKFKKLIKNLFLKDLVFRKTTGFLTSGTANEDFYQYYGVPSQKMVRFPFSWGYERVVARAQELKSQRETLREKFGIKKDEFVIIYVGRLSPEKAPLILLDAYHIVDSSRKKLFFVGDGLMRSEVEQEIKKLGARNITMAGFQQRDKVFDFYVAADVLVLPSRRETWGIVVNEAMCFGLPVIVSDKVGASLDLVGENYNGFIFESGNVEDLAMKLQYMIEMPEEELAEFGKRSYNIIVQWMHQLDPVGQICKLLQRQYGKQEA
jgi:glycosyltransferase involved in cell wall biosynthesis